MLGEHPHPTSTDRDRRSPFARRGFVISAVVLAVIVALAGWLVFGGTGRSRTPTSSPAPATTTRPVAVSPPSRPAPGEACRVPPGSQAIPKTAPAGVTWQLFDTVALPFSARAGPAVVRGDVARCYAHSPTGALIADIQISARWLISAHWRTVLATQVEPGPGVKVYAADRAKVSGPNQPGDYCQAAGFAFLDYTPAAAHIELVSRCGANLQVASTTMHWSGTDWRLVLLSNGSESPTATTVANLLGFTVFGGV